METNERQTENYNPQPNVSAQQQNYTPQPNVSAQQADLNPRTATNSSQTQTVNTQTETLSARRIVGVLFGAVEVILGLRLIFKLLGANSQNGFVKIIYGITQLFVGLFDGIFSKATAEGLESTAVFEPATLIAMIVIALIAVGVLKLMNTSAGSRVVRTNHSDNSEAGGQQR